MMKTAYYYYLCIWAAIPALLAGCSKYEITDESPDAAPAVNFGVYTGIPTRGAETTISTVQSSGFGVFGYYTAQSTWAANTAPNFMYNQKVTYASSAWSYTPQKYWPGAANDKITFFGYAPHSTTANSGIVPSAANYSGNPYLDFTLQTSPANSVDLVTATATNQTKTATVGFTFSHVLSRGKFFAKASESLATGSHVFVKSVKILGSASNSTSKFYTKARYTFNTNVWDYTAANITIPTTNYDLANILNTTAKTGMGGYTTPSVDVTGTTAVPLFKSTDYLFFIPVANSTGTAANDVKVEIAYDIVTVDSQLSAGHTVASNTVQVALPAGTLKKGTAYNFNFTVSMTKVSVTATSVNGWGTVAESEVTVP